MAAHAAASVGAASRICMTHIVATWITMMLTMDELSRRLAGTVRAARQARALSVALLAERAHVSRAMVGKIERGEVQPTAALLARLSGALGMTLSELVARAEGDHRLLARFAEQSVWVDPDSGYRRRAV